MPTIAIISEGRTDQKVLFHLLRGKFPDFDKDTFVEVQPPPTPAGAHGGWALVFECLASGRGAEVLQFSDFLVVQIDTDDCEKPGFEVSRRTEGRERTLEELREAVRERLVSAFVSAPRSAGSENAFGRRFEAYKDRVAFAICIEATECWLLPLVDAPGKTLGCAKALDAALAKRGEKPLNKDPLRYDALARALGKAKELQKTAALVKSLALFLEELAAWSDPPETG
jgi:hypothetical protein